MIMLRTDERDESHSVAKATDRAVNTLPLTHLSTIEPLSLSPSLSHTHTHTHTHTIESNLSETRGSGDESHSKPLSYTSE